MGHHEMERGVMLFASMGGVTRASENHSWCCLAMFLLCTGIMKGKLILETNLPFSLLPFLFDEIAGGKSLHSLSIVNNYKK